MDASLNSTNLGMKMVESVLILTRYAKITGISGLEARKSFHIGSNRRPLPQAPEGDMKSDLRSYSTLTIEMRVISVPFKD